jgi:hypothetical protein
MNEALNQIKAVYEPEIAEQRASFDTYFDQVQAWAEAEGLGVADAERHLAPLL